MAIIQIDRQHPKNNANYVINFNDYCCAVHNARYIAELLFRYMEYEWKCYFYLIKKLPVHAWVEVWKPKTIFSTVFHSILSFPCHFRCFSESSLKFQISERYEQFSFPIFIIVLSQRIAWKNPFAEFALFMFHNWFDKLAAIPEHF